MQKASAAFIGLPPIEGTSEIELRATLIGIVPANPTRHHWLFSILNFFARPILRACECRGLGAKVQLTLGHGAVVAQRFESVKLGPGDSTAVSIEVPLATKPLWPPEGEGVKTCEFYRGNLEGRAHLREAILQPN